MDQKEKESVGVTKTTFVAGTVCSESIFSNKTVF